jgi:hypothetical protein
VLSSLELSPKTKEQSSEVLLSNGQQLAAANLCAEFCTIDALFIQACRSIDPIVGHEFRSNLGGYQSILKEINNICEDVIANDGEVDEELQYQSSIYEFLSRTDLTQTYWAEPIQFLLKWHRPDNVHAQEFAWLQWNRTLERAGESLTDAIVEAVVRGYLGPKDHKTKLLTRIISDKISILDGLLEKVYNDPRYDLGEREIHFGREINAQWYIGP